MNRDNEYLAQSLAALSGLPVRLYTNVTFSGRFREQTGMTLHRYVMKIKIGEAERLLRTTKNSLSEIALCLGFSSQSHFQRAFRDVTGSTPKRFRDENV